MTLPDSHRYGPLQQKSQMLMPTLLAYIVLFVIFLYYLCLYLDFYPLRPLVELLWNCLVYLVPDKLISFLHPAYSVIPPQDERTATATSSTAKNRARKSEALRKILGLDSVDSMGTLQRSGPEPAEESTSATLSDAPPGLGNWDNSCYQNSVLQGLASLESLPEYLTQANSSEELSTGLALRELIERLNSPANAGRMFWTPPDLKNMSSWQQQDAQEYFSKVLDEIDKEVSKSATGKARNSGLLALVEPGSKGGEPQGAGNGPRSSSRLHSLPNELKALMVRNPLEGLLGQRVGCLQCGYVEGLSLIPFNCLTVSLGRDWIYDIRTCLDEYTSLEPINGVECVKCTLLRAKQHFGSLLEQFESAGGTFSGENGEPIPLLPIALRESLEERLGSVTAALDAADFSDNVLKKCEISAINRVSTTKSRQAVIARPPKSLIIHINRSVFNEMTGIQFKNPAAVRFPDLLDLSPWRLGSNVASLLSKDGRGAIEEWNADPAASMLSPEMEDIPPGLQELYELRAVVTHYGKHENGHYICYRRYPRSPRTADGESEEAPKRWWRLSDDDVTEVSKDFVLSQGGVFMLFYDRLEKSWLSKGGTFEDTMPEVCATQPTEAKAFKDLDKLDDMIPLLVPTAAPVAEYSDIDDLAVVAHSAEATPDDQSRQSTRDKAAPNADEGFPISDTMPSLTSSETSPPPTAADLTISSASSEVSNTPPTEPAPSESISTAPSTRPPSTCTPTKNSDPDSEPIPDLQDPTYDNRQVTPAMRTAPPRSESRSSKGMGQVSSMISAN